MQQSILTFIHSLMHFRCSYREGNADAFVITSGLDKLCHLFSGPGCSKHRYPNDVVKTTTRLEYAYYITKYIAIFVGKNARIFCNVRDSHIFPTKNNSVFVILTF